MSEQTFLRVIALLALSVVCMWTNLKTPPMGWMSVMNIVTYPAAIGSLVAAVVVTILSFF